MCTTKELITFLQQFPDNTEVEVLETYLRRDWGDGVKFESLNIEEYSRHWDLCGAILYLGKD